MNNVRKDAATELGLARETLGDAETILNAGVPHVAAREAYYAAYHAAQARIAFSGRDVPGTHKGVSMLIGQIYSDGEFRAQSVLSKLEDLKEASDYARGKRADGPMAREAIDVARDFVDRIASDLGDSAEKKQLTAAEMARLLSMKRGGIGG